MTNYQPRVPPSHEEVPAVDIILVDDTEGSRFHDIFGPMNPSVFTRARVGGDRGAVRRMVGEQIRDLGPKAFDFQLIDLLGAAATAHAVGVEVKVAGDLYRWIDEVSRMIDFARLEFTDFGIADDAMFATARRGLLDRLQNMRSALDAELRSEPMRAGLLSRAACSVGDLHMAFRVALFCKKMGDVGAGINVWNAYMRRVDNDAAVTRGKSLFASNPNDYHANCYAAALMDRFVATGEREVLDLAGEVTIVSLRKVPKEKWKRSAYTLFVVGRYGRIQGTVGADTFFGLANHLETGRGNPVKHCTGECADPNVCLCECDVFDIWQRAVYALEKAQMLSIAREIEKQVQRLNPKSQVNDALPF